VIFNSFDIGPANVVYNSPLERYIVVDKDFCRFVRTGFYLLTIENSNEAKQSISIYIKIEDGLPYTIISAASST
jgi:hypothetical protein